MEGYGPKRDRATTEEVRPPLSRGQAFKIGGDTEYGSPVTVSHGLLFVEGTRRLHALALDTGRERWRLNLPGFFLSPAVAGDRVFVRAESAQEGYLWALGVGTGRELWRFRFPRVGSSYDNIGGHVTSPVIAGGLVLVGASRCLYALDAASGEQRWAFDTQAPISSSAAVADDTVYIADFAHLYAVDLETGTQSWRFDHPESVSLFFAPIVAQDRVAITGYETVYAVDRKSGDLLWSQVMPGEDLVPAAAARDRIYCKSVNRLYALDRETGAIAWSYRAGDFVSLPAIAGEQLYVITRAQGKSQLRALRLTDGQEIWGVEQSRLSNAAPVIAGGRVYVRTVDGQVLVYAS